MEAGLRCSHCGSFRLARNPEGMLVCMSCGSVVSEDVIEDVVGMYSWGEPENRGAKRRGRPFRRRSALHPSTLRAIYRRVLRVGGVYDYEKRKVVSLLDLEAERISRGEERVAAARKLLEDAGVLEGKTSRVAVGLALYVLCRAEGKGKERCVREASNKSGASVSRLRVLAAEYSPLLDDIAVRVQRGCREES